MKIQYGLGKARTRINLGAEIDVSDHSDTIDFITLATCPGTETILAGELAVKVQQQDGKTVWYSMSNSPYKVHLFVTEPKTRGPRKPKETTQNHAPVSAKK